jgi:predicted ribosome quality control (RQC) complex YloA/Tae2 family protein
MSNFDIAVLLKEIAQFVIGAWINNVYQIGETFLLKLNTKSGEKSLIIEPGFSLFLTKYQRTVPKSPTNFCSSLRKHIRNRRVEGIAQYDLDRIVEITISGERGSCRVIAELFGQGNLILCDPENKIILARRYRIMRDRSVKPKEIYLPPPLRGTDLLELSPNEVSSMISASSAKLAETLASGLNIDPLYAEEVCALSNLKPDVMSKDLDGDGITKVFNAIQLTVNRLKNGPYTPQIVYDASGKPLSTAPFNLTVFKDLPSKKTENYNEAIDDFFSLAEAATAKGLREEEFDSKIRETENTIQEQRKKISESEELANKNRMYGNLTYSNLPGVEGILSTILSARRKGVSWQEIEKKFEEGKKTGTVPTIKVSSFSPAQGTIILHLNGDEVALDLRLTATENGSRFYELAKRAEGKKKGAESALHDALEKLRRLQSEGTSLQEKTLKVKRVKKWYENYRWFLSSDGFLVIGGRDARTNEEIVKKRMEPTDIFVHADVHGAPVVIIKTEGKEVPESTLMEASQFAVSYSSLWKLGTGTGDAYFVKSSQVSFSPPSGEYLPKGSFMIRGERTYMKSVQLRISVSVIVDEKDNVVPLAGPPSSIAKKTKISIEIAPGEENRSKLAQSIKDELTKIAGQETGKKVEQITLDEFLQILPSGGSRII